MLKVLVRWLGLKAQARPTVPSAGSPCFEPLEPRVLLSADLAGVQPVLSCEVVAADPALHVGLERQDITQPEKPSALLKLSVLSDTIPPTIDGFSVSPVSVPLGGTFTISYTVSDAGGSGLSLVELWRTGDPNSWPAQALQQQALSGNGPVSGDFGDIPPSTGDWWYGIRVADGAGTWTTETAGGGQPIHVVVDPPDTTLPSPNPSQWDTEPYATSTTSIRMAAVLAFDANGVQYYFEETSDNYGGTDSGWQDSRVYEDTGLLPDTTYTYCVKTRDKSPSYNETGYSAVRSASTDLTAPSPNPGTWATQPCATSSTSIKMTATTASDANGVQYYFHCFDAGGHDSGWQASAAYEDTALTPGTYYAYEVKTRDQSLNQNEGASSTAAGAVTPTPVYRFWSPTLSRHFYTISEGEKNKLLDNYSNVWTYETVAYYAFSTSQPGTSAVYRFWSGTLNAHVYTINPAERDKLLNNYSHIWTYEGTAFYAYALGAQPTGTAGVCRFWSGTLNCHFYTMNSAERDKLINLYFLTWTYEGIMWYAYGT